MQSRGLGIGWRPSIPWWAEAGLTLGHKDPPCPTECLALDLEKGNRPKNSPTDRQRRKSNLVRGRIPFRGKSVKPPTNLNPSFIHVYKLSHDGSQT